MYQHWLLIVLIYYDCDVLPFMNSKGNIILIYNTLSPYSPMIYTSKALIPILSTAVVEAFAKLLLLYDIVLNLDLAMP